MRKELKFALVVALLVLSVPAYRLIPWGGFWGLDFQNMWAFHHCEQGNSPYLATGAQCGDVGNRDMIYPPLLYWSFSWVRVLKWETALTFWAVFIALGTFASLLFWIRKDEWTVAGERQLSTYLVLLLLQFPVVFAVERGNNDVLVVVGWTVAVLLYLSGRKAASGFIAGLTTAAKLYPLFACAVIFIALLVRAVRFPAERREAVRFGGAYAVAGLLSVAVLFPDLRAYLSDELPRFSKQVGELAIYSHNLRQLAPETPSLSIAIALALLAIWSVAAVRLIDRDPLLIFAGALSISTYFASVSFDYNLLTTLPLLVVLFVRSARGSTLAFAALMLGLVAIMADRSLYVGSPPLQKLRLALQVAWLASTGLVATRLRDGGQLLPLPIRKT